MGFPPENIVLIKTICGDASDDIKNVKSIGEKTLFNIFPEISKEIVTLEEIKSKCQMILDSDSGAIPTKVAKNILEGITDGVQGSDIININDRLVDLTNHEFITEECIDNLNKIGFLSEHKYKAIDSPLLLKKMQDNGIYEHITQEYTSLKKFFKPFLKTFIK